MSLAQIEYFVAVSESGHVGRAAEALRIAQPAVSRQIRSLESELGTQLFIRTPRGMRLSPGGALFLEHARSILAQVHTARVAVQTFARREGDAPLDEPLAAASRRCPDARG